MKYGYCFVGVCPVRRQAESGSEQVSQLLFGEYVEVKERNESWSRIRNLNDDYEGYIDSRNILAVSRTRKTRYVSTAMYSYMQMDRELIPVPFGAYIIDKKYSLAGHDFEVTGNNFEPLGALTKENIKDIVLPFLNTPYMWGGKSPMGMDCSGFVQVVYSVMGFRLKRDSGEQFLQGDCVENFSQAKEGDLVFFGKDKENISHVGIFLGKHYVIHCSGRVRIDFIDEKGIVDHDRREYSHFLQGIRRL